MVVGAAGTSTSGPFSGESWYAEFDDARGPKRRPIWRIRMKPTVVCLLSIFLVSGVRSASTRWPAAKAPVIPEADGYVEIPGAAVLPEKSHRYRAIFDATSAADKPTQLVPALNMAGSELNALGVAGVPLGNAKFAVVFHGAAMDGLLTEAAYKAKFGVSNPNLKVLAELKKAGVELFVCGQNVAFADIDPKTLAHDVVIASDALIVLMTYQSNGYALLSF
jgi:intracellular sulfur oxidation DsrE/DsrF family protein